MVEGALPGMRPSVGPLIDWTWKQQAGGMEVGRLDKPGTHDGMVDVLF